MGKFKIGDMVSVIHDDLKGKVTSVNKDLVHIKDEHGFIYSFQSKELVLVDKDLYLGIVTEKKEEVTPKKSKKHNAAPMVIDLHWDKIATKHQEADPNVRITIQKEQLLDALEQCKRKGHKELRVIHGIGDGTLQRMVENFLASKVGLNYYHEGVIKEDSGSIFVEFK